MLPFPLRVCTWRKYPPRFMLLFSDGPFFLLDHLYPSLSTCTLLDNTALTVPVEIVCWPVFTPFQLLVIKYSKSWVTAFDIVFFFFLTSEFVGMTHPRSWLTSLLQWHLPQLCLSHAHLREWLHLQPCHHQFLQTRSHHFKGNELWTILSIFPNCCFCSLQSSHPEVMGYPASVCPFCLTQYNYPCPGWTFQFLSITVFLSCTYPCFPSLSWYFPA